MRAPVIAYIARLALASLMFAAHVPAILLAFALLWVKVALFGVTATPAMEADELTEIEAEVATLTFLETLAQAVTITWAISADAACLPPRRRG
jgi:hypothetical protein